ncbi:hypothetical protein C2845_PM11G08010 [Panicum miliaceum]|uniref:Uncharacterized protein n=1 Tax=Panicum miliaceum TaxID=4540 RepID=A0A3L6RPE1_PANMI|nr:hypothetical protein C2845_PM11G08010 [Panicum miliaceum]
MASWSKLCAFITRFFLEVRRADQLTTPYRQKAICTTIVLFVFLTANQLPLYGTPFQRAAAAPDPLHWGHPIFTQPDGSLLALGIGPVLLSEIVTRILVNTDAAPEAPTPHGNILWKAFSPMMFIYPEQRVQYEGAVPAWAHLLITRTDKLSAIREAFCRRNLPNVTSLLGTCLFVPIAISFQGLSSVVLPVRTQRGVRSFQSSYLIKTSNMLYGPIVLHRFLVSSLYITSQLLSMKYSGNQLLNLLGAWSRPNRSGQSFLDQRALAQPDSIPRNEFSSHVLKAARLGGLCAGALIILGDSIGVLGSGTALYPYFDGRSGDVGAFGF